ncbi:MAG: hypothetical protein P8M22_03090 [Phycisphaerales bacterium]|nr:hypothetical protein [Phycisphaerales bacterium]
MTSQSATIPPRTIRLGTILVHRGILEEQQVQRVLEVQERTGDPFGLLCEKLFGIAPSIIESAWAQQYASLVDSTDFTEVTPTPEALEMITRRQAWQFRVMPISWDGYELTLATTSNDLCRALRFATNVIDRAVYFVMTDSKSLDDALVKHYPLPGVNAARSRAA